jgi:hypothetical protein
VLTWLKNSAAGLWRFLTTTKNNSQMLFQSLFLPTGVLVLPCPGEQFLYF